MQQTQSGQKLQIKKKVPVILKVPHIKTIRLDFKRINYVPKSNAIFRLGGKEILVPTPFNSTGNSKS
jgi:hypothetical protein